MTLPFAMDPLDPYYGLPADAVRPPYEPVVGLPMESSLTEPTEVCTFGPDGFIRTRRPAPILKCVTCGQDTTRSVPIAGHCVGVERYTLDYAAECSRCGTALAIRSLKARQANPELSEKVRAEEAVLLAEMSA